MTLRVIATVALLLARAGAAEECAARLQSCLHAACCDAEHDGCYHHKAKKSAQCRPLAAGPCADTEEWLCPGHEPAAHQHHSTPRADKPHASKPSKPQPASDTPATPSASLASPPPPARHEHAHGGSHAHDRPAGATKPLPATYGLPTPASRPTAKPKAKAASKAASGGASFGWRVFRAAVVTFLILWAISVCARKLQPTMRRAQIAASTKARRGKRLGVSDAHSNRRPARVPAAPSHQPGRARSVARAGLRACAHAGADAVSTPRRRLPGRAERRPRAEQLCHLKSERPAGPRRRTAT